MQFSFRCASTRVSGTFAAATFEQIHDVFFNCVYLLHISFAYLIPSFYGGYVFGLDYKFIQALPCENGSSQQVL